MSNQEKKNSPHPDSHLNSVGKAVMLGSQLMATGKTIAIFDASRVPEGCELYVEPSVDRLKMEVVVANDNALHWKEGLDTANIRAAQLRTEKFRLLGRVNDLQGRADRLSSELQKAKLMLLNIHDSQYPSATSTDIYQFLFGSRK